MSIHFPPPVGPTWRQCTCHAQFSSCCTEQGIERAEGGNKDYHAYLRSNLSQDDMNCPTDDIIAPGLIIVPERFLGKRGNARIEAIILGIGTNTALLDSTAKGLYSRGLGLNHRGSIDLPSGQGIPLGEVWYPGIVLQYCTILIKPPKGNLEIGLLALANSSAYRGRNPTAWVHP